MHSCEVIGTYNPLSRLDLSQKRLPVYLADGLSCEGVLHEIALGLHDGPEQEAPVRTHDSNNGVQWVEEVRMLVHVGAGQPGLSVGLFLLPLVLGFLHIFLC